MNTKRQTIWLVSMLSLMVILSAYYLFTDKVDENQMATEIPDANEASVEFTETGEHSELSTEEDWEGLEDAAETGHTDEQVLQKVSEGAMSAEEVMASLDMKRMETLTKETERLMDIALDPQKSSEEVGKAEQQLQWIEETQAKISDIEDELMREYENVVISEQSGRWNVVIQTDNLQKSEVVTIIDMLNEQLRVNPGKVAVQYIN